MDKNPNRNYLYEGKIRVKFDAPNKENPKQLDFKKYDYIDCYISQHKDSNNGGIDDNLIFLDLLGKREIHLEITLNEDVLGEERIDLTYTNIKSKRSGKGSAVITKKAQ